MSQFTFALTGPSSVGTFKSVRNLVNTKHVAGPGLIKTNITSADCKGRADIFKTARWLDAIVIPILQA